MRNRFFFCAIIVAVVALSLASCKTAAPVVEVRTDTVCNSRDSIIIQERIVEVEVPVPEVHIERVVAKDTTSVIQTELYKSTAWISDGLLHHVLESVKYASVTGEVKTTDTTAISEKETTTTNKATQTVEVNVLTKSQKFFCTSGKILWCIIITAILLLIARFLLKKYGVIKN